MKNKSILLGVNLDHVATLRQARGTHYPDPVQAVFIVEEAGADSITVHLREDRRHIQERDVLLIQEVMTTPLNLEMAVTKQMLQFAETLQPQHACFVPEKREEKTTEGGLDVMGQRERIHEACHRLSKAGIEVSLFIEPDEKQIEAALHCQVPAIELHTGHYAEAVDSASRARECHRLQQAAIFAQERGLIVNAGHGLNYQNVEAIAAIPEIYTLNIGHSIIAQAVFIGLEKAVMEMKNLVTIARQPC